jgi:hypothetical protein
LKNNTAVVNSPQAANQTQQNGDSSDDEEADDSGTLAAVGSQGHLVELLLNSKRVMAATLEIYAKSYDGASDDAKELWRFVYCDAIKSILPKQDKDDLYQKGVTKDKILERVTVSDEAMVMTIVLVKIEETLEEQGSSGVSDVTANSTGGDDSSKGTTAKRKSQGKGGGRKKRKVVGSKKKKVPINHQAGALDPELGRNVDIFQKMRARIMKARSVQSANDDGLGWYNAIAMEITELRKKEKALDNLFDSAGMEGGMPTLLCDLTSGDNDMEMEGGEFSRCPYTAAVIEEEIRQAKARGLYVGL